MPDLPHTRAPQHALQSTAKEALMTTDDFTKAARAEAERRFDFLSDASCFEQGAEWARTYLAAQEPTDAEVLDTVEDRLHDAMFTACVQEPDGEMTTYVDAPLAEVLRIVRCALSAARATRRDEEKRAACGCDLTGPVPPAVHIVDQHEERR